MLTSMGFVGSKADSSLYFLHQDDMQLFFLIYVDDIIITWTDPKHIDWVIHKLSLEFPIKDLGNLSYFLRIEALRTNEGLFLTQQKYIVELLRKAILENAKPCLTPMATNCHLTKFDGTAFDNPMLYRSRVGGLQYLGFTRPDIAFAVHRVSKFIHCPKDTHWQAVKRILRYLKYFVSDGLFLSANSANNAFSDAD